MSPHVDGGEDLHANRFSDRGALVRGKYLGVVELGDTFSFSLDPHNDFYVSGDANNWFDVDTHLNNLLFSVIENATQTQVLSDQRFEDYISGSQKQSATEWEGILFAKFSVDDTDFNVGGYTIKIYGFGEGTDADSFTTYTFNVLHMSAEKEASIVARRLDRLRDNQEWMINDIENVIFPRLKRLLGFEGENLLLDLFTYDNAGNIVSMRARIFDTSANCQSATSDLDPTDTPEPGELWTYTITQAHNLPRNTRTEHKSVLDYNGGSNNLNESLVTDNFKETDVTVAPRNVHPRSTIWPQQGDTYAGNFYD